MPFWEWEIKLKSSQVKSNRVLSIGVEQKRERMGMRALVFHWRAIDSNAVDEQKTQTPSNAIRFCSLNFPMTFSHYSKNKCCEPSPSDHTVCVSSFGFWGLVLLFLSNGGIMVWPFFLSKRKFSEQWIRARWLLGTFFFMFFFVFQQRKMKVYTGN